MRYSLKAIWEISYPLFISSLITLYLLLFGTHHTLDFDKFIENGISVFGILLGFFITVLTIINTMDNQYIRAIRASINTFMLMKRYLKNAIWLSFYSIIIGFLYDFILINCLFPTKDFFQVLIFFIITWAILSSYRFIKLFIKIIIP